MRFAQDVKIIFSSNFRTSADDKLHEGAMMGFCFSNGRQKWGEKEKIPDKKKTFYDTNSSLNKDTIRFNTLSNDTILDWSKLKSFADDKINVTKELKFIFGREENIVGKGENAGYQNFLLFQPCFQKTSFTGRC